MNSEKYIIKEDLKLIGIEVKTFPEGIGEMFNNLFKMLPDATTRSYYGVSEMDNDGKVVYFAAAEEKNDGEAEKYNCQGLVVKQGDYLAVHVKNWRDNTDCIKDVFHEMMQDSRVDNSTPCVEWYKDDKEMLCLIRFKKTNS